MIAAIAVVNVGLGIAQEARAEAALAALSALAATRAVVVRDGAPPAVVPAADLVPGDVILLAPTGAGSAVPVDAVLVEAADLSVVEATLTGEPAPARKAAPRGGGGSDAAAAAARVSAAMVYSGTQVVTGRGTAVVVKTGMDTALGRIVARVGAAPVRRTQLQREMARAGLALFAAGVFLAFVVFAANKFNVDNPAGVWGERRGGGGGVMARRAPFLWLCVPSHPPPLRSPPPPHPPPQACATQPSTPSPPSSPSSLRSCPSC